jgi:flagellar hook-associated protein 2
MTSSIDGLISGMSTSDMISQLMRVEAVPQTALKAKVSAQNKAVAAYQSVNTRMSSVLTAARALGKSEAWGAMKASSSSDAVAVTAAAGAAAGSISFTVDRLAAAHTVTFDGWVGSLTDATTSAVMSGGSLSVRRTDGTTVSVSPSDGSLQSVITAINSTTDAAYRAAALQVSPGKYTLQLTAIETGDAGVFAAAPAEIDQLGPTAVTTQGVDAKIILGTTADAVPITSATNTFADVLPGITLTVSKQQTATPVTVTLVPDTDGLAAKAQALVDSANVALSEIVSQTRPRNGDLPAGPMVGDSALRNLTQEILGTVSGGAGNLGSLSQVGVSVTRDGKLAFDKSTFLTSLAADPKGTRAYFDSYENVAHTSATDAFQPGWDTATGLARKLEHVAATASEGVILPTDPADKPKVGTLTELAQRRNDFIRDLNAQVAAWDVRLSARKSALQRQWGNLEVSLGKLKSQSTWLAGQLAGLPSSS